MVRSHRFDGPAWYGSPGTLLATLVALAALLALTPLDAAEPQQRPVGEGFSFRTAVNLINVAVTVTDEHGRFVPGLQPDDFLVFEDGEQQQISQFEAERVPVSLGIALDTSGSMVGDKIEAARAALDRFLFDLLGPEDEVFLYRFDRRPDLVEGWTENRQAVSRALGRVRPVGGTAMYDTVAEAVPLAQTGTRRKKALLIISDGQDTSSRTSVSDLRRLIRRTEVLVYAIGIDASGEEDDGRSSASNASRTSPARPRKIPVPTAFPGQKPVVKTAPPQPTSQRPTPRPSGSSDRVDHEALRQITDDSGGRTEIIISASDLDPATASIADELSRQYFIGYVSNVVKDGRWHTIDVQLRRGNYQVRARRGFVAN
jgi:Ca-activated chloride channel family protein